MSSFLSSGAILGDGKYLLGRKLGSGSLGDVYFGTDLESEERVAIKLESWNSEQMLLSHEFQVCKTLEGEKGFPSAHWFSEEKRYRHNIMAMDLLGPSLKNLQRYESKFSIKTVLILADQLLKRMEYLHSKRFIHRSIKPENFAMGRQDPTQVYMIDFSYAKRYLNKSGEHIKYKVYDELELSNCHSRHQSIERMERSRRDDLESLGYMFISFLKGRLPWDKVANDPVALKKVKIGTSIKSLCEGCPVEFAKYMAYVRSLNFEETPDYDAIRAMFKELYFNLGFEYDGKFDWTPQEKQVENRIFATTNFTRTKVHER